MQFSWYTINQISNLPLNARSDKLEVFVVMVGCFPSTPKKLAMTIACSLSGAVVLAVGMHLSYVNVEPQRARTMARDKLVLDTLRKKYGYIPPSEVRSMARSDSSKENS
ncbi:uncharacterized protein LOC127127893 [Lathyrus oleraceus]|nr:uncharacterized protein LOC127127893 [Pisum sativum]